MRAADRAAGRDHAGPAAPVPNGSNGTHLPANVPPEANSSTTRGETSQSQPTPATKPTSAADTRGARLYDGGARGPGHRSLELLAWVCRLQVVSAEAAWTALRMSQSVGYSHLRRLEDAGLLSRQRALEETAAIITRAGARLLDDPGRLTALTQTPSLGGVAHAQAVSWVAARQQLAGRRWLAERELRHIDDWRLELLAPGTGQRQRHRPDLGVIIQGRRVAVEVELTRKTPRRVDAILDAYRRAIAREQLHRVVYITATRQVGALIARRAATARLDGRIEILDLDDLRAAVRAQRSLAG